MDKADWFGWGLLTIYGTVIYLVGWLRGNQHGETLLRKLYEALNRENPNETP